MTQIKIIQERSNPELEKSVNQFLNQYQSGILDLTYDYTHKVQGSICIAFIIYDDGR